MAIGSTCNSDVVIAHKTNSAPTAARFMRERYVGDLIVTEPRDSRQFRPAYSPLCSIFSDGSRKK